LLSKKQKNKSDVSCPYISNEENAEWNETNSNFGQSVRGNCISGYKGIASRSCIQVDSTGLWTQIYGSCDGIFFLKKKEKRKKKSHFFSNQN